MHLDALYRTARRMTRNDRDAEDLVQETITRAFRFFHHFTVGTNCRAWLMRIMHNAYLNSVQRKARTPLTLSLEDTEDFYLYSHMRQSAEPGAEEIVVAATWDQEILDALDRLPREFRMAVVLSDIEELPYKDIADILEVPIGTVRSRLARGRRLLQKYLWDYMQQR